MARELSDILDNIKLVLRQVIEKVWPDEIALFEMTLGQLRAWPNGWEDTSPTEWKAQDLLTEAAAEGFAYPGAIPAETPPWIRFGLVVAIVVEHFRASADMPDESDIEAVYEKIGLEADLSERVLDVARLAVVEMVRSYFIHRTVPELPAAHYVVYEGSVMHRCREEKELEKFRGRKKKYDIYVDDLRCEILVEGDEPNLRAGETSNFSLLKCLLRRVGAHWTHDELFEKLGMLDPNDKDSKVTIETDRRTLLHRMLNSIRKSLGDKAGEAKVNGWFDSSNPKRVVVATNLKSCLIESLL